MKKLLIVLSAGLAFAAANLVAAPVPQPAGQSWHGNNGQGQGNRNDRADRRNDRDRRDRRGGSDRGRYDDDYARGGDRGRHDNGRRFYGMHDRGRHEGWYHRGGRLPVEYRVTRYYVPDYRVYNLREPPRGYRWVRSDNGDFLMVAIATGIIASIILAGN